MCLKCNKEFEEFKSLRGTPEGKYEIDMPTCPDCGASTKKLVSASNFHLKGSGWAKDLYSKPPKKG
jgi:putative FmdB family regulatory protein